MREILLPKLGQTMEEATIERWHKKEGDPVRRGDVVLEITTDKATLEVESYVEGTLRKIIAREGLTLPVNAVIALVGEPDEPLPDGVDDLIAAAEAGTASGAETQPEPEAAPVRESAPSAAGAGPAAPVSVAPPPGRLFASPRARMRAEQHRVNLRLLRGSGPGGRIVEKDVLDYVERAKAIRMSPTAREIAYRRGVDVLSLPVRGRRVTKADVLAARPAPEAAATALEPLSAMRRIVAERMARSQREVPHFYLVMEVDMTDAAAFRAAWNETAPRKLSYNDLLLKACGLAMRDVPAMAAVWAETGLVRREEINIGLAVALEDGLIVPVVRGVDRLPLEALAAESARLVGRARGKRLTPEEYEGGCFTVTNLGMYGVDAFAAIVNPGESGILAVGRIAARPVVVGEAIHIRSMMTMTLSADHRVVDGATAARFLARVKELLEQPEQLRG